MMSKLATLWSRDRTLNSYVFTQFILGFPFTIVGTYVIYQVQLAGYMIGTDIGGGTCVDYCIVPFGTGKLDLNSVILYTSALGNGIGGFCSLVLTAYADYWGNKTQLVALFIALYGAIGIPSYFLRTVTKTNFESLIALYVLFLMLTYITTTLMNIYIPHCMKVIAAQYSTRIQAVDETGVGHLTIQDQDIKTIEPSIAIPVANLTIPAHEELQLEDIPENSMPRKYGFKMSILGAASTAISSIITLIVVIVLAQKLPSAQGQNAGLLVATVTSFITLAGAILSYIGLPVVPAKPRPRATHLLLGLVTPFRELFQRWNMFALLLSYTIYNDALFAMGSVVIQLYYQEIKPATLEYSLFTLAGALFSFVTTLVFYFWQSWRPPFKLEYWLTLGYGIAIIVPLWGCVGFVTGIKFGLKARWEFYVQSFLQYLSLSIASATFRVLFAELVPKGSEIQWFGLQTVLSCATSWISYVVTAPLQAQTHNLRFPLVLSAIFLFIPMALEIARNTMALFAQDRIRWNGNGVILAELTSRMTV